MPGAELVSIGRALRDQVLCWVGIPTCVGFAPTKTLAKLANHVAKNAERKPGSYPAEYAQVFNLGACSATEVAAVLMATEVGEVWGVGPRTSARLKAYGIHTAQDLTRVDSKMLRREFSVVLEKTALELQGVSCARLEDVPTDKKQIACTRSFGRPVLELAGLAEAVSSFAMRAAEKLRSQNSAAGTLQVFIHTSPFRTDDPQYSRSVTVPLSRPTSDTNILVSAALAGLRQIYRTGFKFAKAGVMLMDLVPETVQQAELDLICEFDGLQQPPEKRLLMKAIDGLNRRYGRGAVGVASAGTNAGSAPRGWTMLQERRTPAYTTCWEDIAIARA